MCQRVRNSKQCTIDQRATKAPRRAATTPIKKPEDCSERAPLVPFSAPAVDAAVPAEEVSVATAVTAAALEGAADEATAVISCGIMRGLPLRLPKETVPSSLMVSGLAAKKVRVNLDVKSAC